MNAFECENGRSELPEQFHSEFLGAAMRASLKEGERSLFVGVWKLCAPDDWKPPSHGRVVTEQRVNQGERIDICLLDDEPPGRVVGIEVKTKRASAEYGQLERYLVGLQEEFPGAGVAIAYLTPFNREQAGEDAGRLRTVEVFDKFAEKFEGRHVSWRDVAAIEWGGGVLWSEHQAYVRNVMASDESLQRAISRNRLFDAFFGEDATDQFRMRFKQKGVDSTVSGFTLDLHEFLEDPDFIAKACEILIEASEGAPGMRKENELPDKSRTEFLESTYGLIHAALFDLTCRYDHVWLKGKGDYGLRVAHKKHSSGVSLVTSQGPGRLLIEQPR